jgi:hypothetical protein
MFPEELAHPFQRGMFRLDEQVEHLAFGIHGAPWVNHVSFDF